MAMRSAVKMLQPMALFMVMLLSVLIASTWLVFPYFVRDLNLIENVGADVKQERLSKSVSIGRFLNRSSFGIGEAQVDVLYATPEFFEVTDRAQVVTEYRPDLYHVFLVTETTHIEELPSRLPEARLFVDGREYLPIDIEGPLEVYHHRNVAIRFPAFLEDGTQVVGEDADLLRLQLNSSWDPGGTARSFEWQLPIQYPEDLINPSPWTFWMVGGLAAGLLSFVLTPCLIQLLAVYLVSLAGFSAESFMSEKKNASAEIRRTLFFTALSFIAGFTLLFTLTGAVIGEAGKQMQLFFAVWSPTLSVIAGILVILMGLWVGVRSRAPLVCRLVPETLRSTLVKPSSHLGAALVAAGFSLGCLTCFGGAIIATLLIYVGSIGSALVGAGIMLAFSAGVAVPFLIAATFLGRALPLLSRVHGYAPQIGFVSMVVIVAFGLVLVTDQFHVLSNFIYPYLGLA